MRPTQHQSNNDVLRAPPGVPIEECTPLAITRGQYPDGLQVVRSYWRPSEAERAAIADGALIQFQCWGQTHPPVYIGVSGPELQALRDGYQFHDLQRQSISRSRYERAIVTTANRIRSAHPSLKVCMTNKERA